LSKLCRQIMHRFGLRSLPDTTPGVNA